MFPVLLSVFGGLTDFGLNMWARGKLSGAVAHGAQYAYLKKTETGANANVASAVQKAADAVLSGTVVTVVGPACIEITKGGRNVPQTDASYIVRRMIAAPTKVHTNHVFALVSWASFPLAVTNRNPA